MKIYLLRRNIKRKEAHYHSSVLLIYFHREVCGGYEGVRAGYRQLVENDKITWGYEGGTGRGDIVDRL